MDQVVQAVALFNSTGIIMAWVNDSNPVKMGWTRFETLLTHTTEQTLLMYH